MCCLALHLSQEIYANDPDAAIDDRDARPADFRCATVYRLREKVLSPAMAQTKPKIRYEGEARRRWELTGFWS
jgi:hypothetical protein